MSATEMTFQEALRSATGYDEIAVARHFDIDLYVEDNKHHPMTLARAAVFIVKRHEGLSDLEAKDFALSMASGDSDDFFADEPEDIDPDEPDSEVGKGISAPA